MTADLILNADEIAAYCLADSVDLPAIAVGDTVRYAGKRQHWIVDAILSDGTAQVSCSTGRRTGPTGYTRVVRLDRLEFVRHGNRHDDAVDEFRNDPNYLYA